MDVSHVSQWLYSSVWLSVMCQILVDLYQSLQWSVNVIVAEVWSMDQLQGTGGAREVGGSGGDDLWWGFPLFQWCHRQMEEERAADCKTGCRGCWEWKCPWVINKPIKVNMLAPSPLQLFTNHLNSKWKRNQVFVPSLTLNKRDRRPATKADTSHIDGDNTECHTAQRKTLKHDCRKMWSTPNSH